MSPTTVALVVMALLFAVYVIVQVRPTSRRGGRRASGAIRAAHARAREAKSPEARAAALAEAGEAAASAGRWVSAAGGFLRALRAEPESAALVHRTAAALAPRPRMLEPLLLRRIAALAPDPDEPADPVLLALIEELAALYRRGRDKGDKGRALTLERLLARERP